jgi:hypothetical protein
MVECGVARLDRLRQCFINSRHRGRIQRGSLVRVTNLQGYGDLLREFAADPRPFSQALRDPRGDRTPGDSFVLRARSFALEVSSAELKSGLRIARIA